jgi:tripartite-type tricarboxylate transporter receptor subunit TctC
MRFPCDRRCVLVAQSIMTLFARTGFWLTWAVLAGSTAQAQVYPSKAVRLIVPYAAGGGADIVGRTLAGKLSESLGQQIVVDNRPGAAGNIGAELVARGTADGYLLLLVGPNHTTNISLFRKLGYDPVRDFEPISLLTAAPYILIVHPSLPVRNVRDFIALARTKPGQLNYGSAGNGTAGHLAMEFIKSSARIDLLHVPYKGSPPVLTDLIGGQITAAFDNVLSSLPHIKAGRLRAIGSSAPRRSPALPDVPTIAESGLPGFDVTVWQGLLAPASTPREIVTRLHDETVAALRKADVRARMAELGVEVIAGSPQEFAAFIARDIDKWAQVIRASGARLD